MKARKYLVAAALIVGSVGIGSITTQGSGAVSSVLAAPAEAGDEEGYSFVPVTPYRVEDTRNYEVKLEAGDQYGFSVLMNMLGEQMIPDTAVAVTYNLTVTQTEGTGFLSIFPGNVLKIPESSSINWKGTNLNIANGGTVGIGDFCEGSVDPACEGEGSLWIRNGSEGATHFILDITGYYK